MILADDRFSRYAQDMCDQAGFFQDLGEWAKRLGVMGRYKDNRQIKGLWPGFLAEPFNHVLDGRTRIFQNGKDGRGVHREPLLGKLGNGRGLRRSVEILIDPTLAVKIPAA